MSQAKIYWDK